MSRVRAAGGIQWALRDEGLLLIEAASGRSLALDCVRGAVWELLQRHGEARAAQRIAPIGGFTSAEAAAFVEECIRSWSDDGWLVREEDHGEHRDNNDL
jgi:hypothetical protein